jgi:hypothetical protein
MFPVALFAGLLTSTCLLLAVDHRAARGASNQSFFIGKRRSQWALAAR